MALLVVFIWAVNFVFVKAAYTEFNAYSFTAIRYLLMLVLAAAVLLGGRGGLEGLRTIDRRDWKRAAVAGVLGFSLYIPISLIGLMYTSVLSNSLLIALTPLFMALLLWMFGVEAIGRLHVAGLAIAVVGTGVYVWDTVAARSLSVSLGDLLSIVSALFFAGYNVVNKPLTLRYPAHLVTAATVITGVIPAVVVLTPSLFLQDWHRVTLLGWSALAFSCLIPVYLAWTLWSWAGSRIGVARTSLFLYLVPVIAGATAWVLLGEGLTTSKLVGAAIVLAGLLVARSAGSGEKALVILRGVNVHRVAEVFAGRNRGHQVGVGADDGPAADVPLEGVEPGPELAGEHDGRVQ